MARFKGLVTHVFVVLSARATVCLAGYLMREGLGKVTAVGSKVSGMAVDDLLFCTALGGAWKAAVATPAASCVKLPAKSTWATGAFAAAFGTAARILDGAALSPGDVVLQTGAGSPTGVALVQLAAARGIQIVSLVEPVSDFASMELVEVRLRPLRAYVRVCTHAPVCVPRACNCEREAE